ncbi:MAG TPA: FadR family transcriptional regulator [Candidatus Merdisoma merdipullorum]|nr:FadR family transcriptional regulator [Candidatus Merdisoma merdipullorum]
MGTRDKPIKKGKLSEIVVERLNAQIRSGELKSGEKLPTERALAESMGVSRTVIREAIRLMVDKNILELRNGRGYVRQLTFDEIVTNICGSIVPGQISLLEIMEVRTVLELYIVKKAAENITEQQIEELQESIDKMDQLMKEGDKGSVEESAFHRGLAEAAGNSALKSIYVLCEELFNSTQHFTWKGVQSVHGAPNTAVADHQAILDALKEHNANRAELLMQAHMDYAKKNLERLYESRNQKAE